MSAKEKLIQKFLKNPKSLCYTDIEKILIIYGFSKIQSKGSHVKFKHSSGISDIIIPVHHNDCKDFYKQYCHKYIDKNNLTPLI